MDANRNEGLKEMANFFDAIKRFEGYTSRPKWDFKQWSNGYGTRASGPNDIIDEQEAQRRFKREWDKAGNTVDKWLTAHAGGRPISMGTRAALTDLTYNSGTKWQNAGLGRAVASGNDAAAKRLFLQYTGAGGKQGFGNLPERRRTGVSWWGSNDPMFAAAMPDGAAGDYGPAGGAVTPWSGPRMALGGPQPSAAPQQQGSINGGYGTDPTGTAGISSVAGMTNAGRMSTPNPTMDPNTGIGAPSGAMITNYGRQSSPSMTTIQPPQAPPTHPPPSQAAPVAHIAPPPKPEEYIGAPQSWAAQSFANGGAYNSKTSPSYKNTLSNVLGGLF